MNKKALLFSGSFAALSGMIYIISIFVNRSYFEALAYDTVFSYELRQLAALLVMFAIGFLFLLFLRETLSAAWIVLFSLPTGLCLWSIVSLLLLLTGIPYTFGGTMLCIFIVLAALLFTARFRKRSSISPDFIKQSAPFLLFFFGLALLAASGFMYSFVSYDSYFYFTNYGHTLTIVKNFKDIVGTNSFTLTNISQFLPLVHSYTAFWGLDQAFQMQSFLASDVIAVFFYSLYLFTDVRHTGKKALAYCILITVLLATSTSFIVASTWILANMYCMAYIFFAMLLSEIFFSAAKKEAYVLAALFFTALTLLRKDGIIFVCFLMIYFALKNNWGKKTLFYIFFPSILFELWWLFYVRIVLKATVKQAAFTSIANNANVAFVVAAITATCIYLFILHPFLEKRLPFPETWLIYAGMLALLILLTLRDWNQVVDNIDMTIRNMFLYPASWGISGILFGLLLVFTLLQHKAFWDVDTFLWLGYTILNFISYCAVGKYLWVNWDDSYNRIVLQIIPVFVFVSGKKLFSLLQSCR